MTRCTAKSKQTGEQCKQPAVPGLEVCRYHGGASPRALAAGQRRHAAQLAQQDADRAVALFGGRRDVHPAVALLELVQMKAAEVAYWRMRVSELQEADMLWGTTKVKTGGDDEGTTEEAKPHIALTMLRTAERDLADYAAASLKAGVDQQLVAVAQSTAATLLLVLRDVLADPRVTVAAGVVDLVIADAVKARGLAA